MANNKAATVSAGALLNSPMGTYKTYNENDSVKLGKFLKCGVGDKNGLMNVHPQNWRITIFISRAPSLRSLVKVFKLLITVRLIKPHSKKNARKH